MRRPIVASIAVVAFIAGATIAAVSADAPVAYDEYNGTTKVRDWRVLPGTECQTAGGSRRLVPDGQPLGVCTPTTTVAPTTTRATTTVAPTSSTTSTTTSTTQAPTTTQAPSGVQFVEDFATAASMDRLQWGVYHRCSGARTNDQPGPFYGLDNNCAAGGTWMADHDNMCGSPDTHRVINSTAQRDTNGSQGWRPLLDFKVPELVFWCPNSGGHFMDTMGDISGYSVVWMTPRQTFTDVREVTFDVNLTDLGTRKWWKVGVVSTSVQPYEAWHFDPSKRFPVPGWVRSDVGTSDLEGITGPGMQFVTWSGQASGGEGGGLKIGDTKCGIGVNAGSDKATRYPVRVTDNGNGTITFTVNGTSCTRAGAFPDGPVKVVIQDHNYTPLKDGPTNGLTFHWDSLVIR